MSAQTPLQNVCKITAEPQPEVVSGKWENEDLAQVEFKVYRKQSNAGVLSCKFCVNDTCFLSGSRDGEVILWNVETGNRLLTLRNHDLHVTTSKLFYENKRILSSSYDKAVCVSDVETGAPIWKAKHPGLVTCADVSPDDKLIVASSDFDYSLYFWDFRIGKPAYKIPGQHETTPLCCSFSPDGQRVASAGMDLSTKILDLVSQKTTITLLGHQNVVSSCCFSKNQHFLCTSSWDKTLQIWDISTGHFRSKGSKVLEEGHAGSVSCCKFFFNDSRVISGGYDQALTMWSATSGEKIITLRGHTGWVNAVDVTTDDENILSASDDGTLRLWSVSNLDKIPVVIEKRRMIASGLVRCEKCFKPYSVQRDDFAGDRSICVFCRLADPERDIYPLT